MRVCALCPTGRYFCTRRALFLGDPLTRLLASCGRRRRYHSCQCALYRPPMIRIPTAVLDGAVTIGSASDDDASLASSPCPRDVALPAATRGRPIPAPPDSPEPAFTEMFVKQRVDTSSPAKSHTSMLTASLRVRSDNPDGSRRHIDVIVPDGIGLCRVQLTRNLHTVDNVISLLVQQHQLRGWTGDYDLRLLDDEDRDDIPDLDLPPLDSAIDLRSFDVGRVAMCHRKRSPALSIDSWESSSPCRLLRVHMPKNECHILPIVEGQHLKDGT